VEIGSNTETDMKSHLRDSFGYPEEQIKIMTHNEITEVFNKEMDQLFDYCVDEGLINPIE